MRNMISMGIRMRMRMPEKIKVSRESGKLTATAEVASIRRQ